LTNFIKKGGVRLLRWKDKITQCFVKVAERSLMRIGVRGEYLSSITMYGLGLFLGNVRKLDESVEILSMARDIVRLSMPVFERAARWVEDGEMVATTETDANGAIAKCPRKQPTTIQERVLADARDADHAMWWYVLSNALYGLSRVMLFVDDDASAREDKLIDFPKVFRFYTLLPLAVIPGIIDFQNFVCQSVNSQMIWLWLNGGLAKHLAQMPELLVELKRIFVEVDTNNLLVQQYVHDQVAMLQEVGRERINEELTKQRKRGQAAVVAEDGEGERMVVVGDEWDETREDEMEHRAPAKKKSKKTHDNDTPTTPRRSTRNRKKSS
jgi:hypothetical protein